MKKRAVLMFGTVAAIVLTGCSDMSVKDDIIVVSDEKMEESKEEKVIEETVQVVPLAESVEEMVYECTTVHVQSFLNSDYSMEIQLVTSEDYENGHDYKLHIHTKPKEGGEGELLYTFPDVREGNMGIGKFKDLYFVDQADMNEDGKLDVFSVARYETPDGLCYDTRVYLCNGKEYEPDYEYMAELNGTYRLTTEGAIDYPIMMIVSGIAEYDQVIAFEDGSYVQCDAYCNTKVIDYRIEVMDDNGNEVQIIEYKQEGRWESIYDPKVEYQDVNADGIEDIRIYADRNPFDGIESWIEYVYDAEVKQFVENVSSEKTLVKDEKGLNIILGKWVLDGLKTDREMEKIGTAWGMEYGSGGKYGAGATLCEDGYFSYYVAIGIGGEGSFVYEDGMVTAKVMPYERITEEQTIELYPKEEDGQNYLVLKMENHEIYLVREE